jgi:hypothetical protein
MKYIRKRSNTYYYRRTIPVSLSGLTDIKVIYRPLSIDKKLASRIAVHYNDLFTMIDLGLKLGHNVSVCNDFEFIRIIEVGICIPYREIWNELILYLIMLYLNYIFSNIIV